MGARETLTFLRESAANFHHVGALAPSSRFLARALAGDITPEAGPLRVLEVGPGTGVLTRELLGRLAPGSHLEIVEINPRFANHVEALLRQARPPFSWDLRRGDVLEQEWEVPYERILSGLPLNNFAPDTVRRILESFLALLTPSGRASWFEYLGIRRLKGVLASSEERRRLAELEEVLEQVVGRHTTHREIVWANLPPAVVHHLHPRDDEPLSVAGGPATEASGRDDD